MPESVIVSREPSAGHADEMQALNLQVFDQAVQIVGNVARLCAGLRICSAAAPAAPIERDRAIPGFDEPWNVVLPAVGIARIGVEQQYRRTASSGVEIPKAHTG